VHAYIVYQLLSRRIQRDLLLVSSLLTSQSSIKTAHRANENQKAKTGAKRVDGRLFPAVVKVLETVLQSRGQMRTLSIVDDSPNLASAVGARLSFTKARR
jgi:signal recognition particle subunit SRP68